jgi:hypothetical protein
MNETEKIYTTSAINIENNSASYFPILTAITMKTVIKFLAKKSWFVV